MSSSLFEEAINLQRAAHELMYLGMDGSPIYSDDLSRRNGEVLPLDCGFVWFQCSRYYYGRTGKRLSCSLDGL